MLDTILAILLIGLVVFSLKFIGALIEKCYKHFSSKRFNSAYPIISPEFPIHELNMGDCISLQGTDGLQYRAKRDGKYYFECISDNTIDGSSYIWIDKDSIMEKATKLYNKKGLKWERYSNDANRE